MQIVRNIYYRPNGRFSLKNKNKFITESQHGFIKARSCLTNTLYFLEDITKWVDDGSPVDVVYLDFQKAFDKVPHQRLLIKLKAYGIWESMISWIQTWLTDRRQRVKVEGGYKTGNQFVLEFHRGRC